MSKEETMQTIDRAIKILKSFSVNEEELSLADLHRKLNVSKSSLQRILNTLVQHSLLDKDEKHKTYRLGIELYFLGQLVEKNSQLLSTAKPFMEKLKEEFGESVSLSIIHENQRKCIGYVPSDHELTTLIHVGQTSPLYAGASAKILMAYLSSEKLEKLLSEITLQKKTDNTITSKSQLKKELKKIREEGYAISNGERVKGAFSISAPIKNRLNEVIAGLTLTIPTARLNQEKIPAYIEKTKETAKEISNRML